LPLFQKKIDIFLALGKLGALSLLAIAFTNTS
jgi:hypothetical protein